MDRRTFLLTGLGAAGAVALGACGDSDDDPPDDAADNGGSPSTTAAGTEGTAPVPRPTLRLTGISSDFGLPSPFTATALPGYLRFSLIYDTLLWQDASGEMLPWLAESFERSADAMSYSFQLREGVLWHDGTPLTAEDVKFTFDYYATHAGILSGFTVGAPQHVREVVVTGPSSVDINLTIPAITFEVFTAGATPIIPRHIWEGIADPTIVEDPALLVGTGAYTLDSYSAAEGSYSYDVNDEYFLGRPFVERIEFPPVADEEVLTTLLDGGVDAAETPISGVRDDVLAPFQGDEYGIVEDPAGFMYPLYFNAGRPGPLADVAFRRAFAHAVDRQDIVDRLFGGNGEPGSPGVVPPSHPFYSEPEQYPFDVDEANRLLDEAGYTRDGDGTRAGPDGAPLRFSFLYQATASTLADLMVPALRDVGVELVPESVDSPPGLFQRKIPGEFDIALLFYPGPVGPGPGGDPDYLRQLFGSEFANGLFSPNGYTNDRLDELTQQQLVAADEDERMEIVAEIQDILATDVPVLPLYYADQFFIYRNDVYDQWYFTPADYPVAAAYNKQGWITGRMTGTEIRPTED